MLDSLPAHKAKMVRDYVEFTNGKLELHFPSTIHARILLDSRGYTGYIAHRTGRPAGNQDQMMSDDERP